MERKMEMTIHEALRIARRLLVSQYGICPRPDDAAIGFAKAKLEGETLGQWSPEWQDAISNALETLRGEA